MDFLLHQMSGSVAFLLLSKNVAAGPLSAAIVASVAVASWAVWRFVDRPGQRATKTLLTKAVARGSGALQSRAVPQAARNLCGAVAME